MSLANVINRVPLALFTELCTIQGVTGTTWAAVGGLASIPCSRQPIGSDTSAPVFALRSGATHQIILRGYYAAAKRGQRAVVGGTYYKIIEVEHDGIQAHTTLHVESTALTG